MAEAQITEEQLELVKRGYELLNADHYDALVDLMAPDVVMERDGGQPPLVGRDEVRRSLEPDAFALATFDEQRAMAAFRSESAS